MFKKAKLYLLLSIVVASTIVSMFGFSNTIFAQTTSAKWEQQEGENTPSIIYNGSAYVLKGLYTGNDAELQKYFKNDCEPAKCSGDDFYFTNDDVKNNIYIFCKNSSTTATCTDNNYIIIKTSDTLPNPITGQSYTAIYANFNESAGFYYINGSTTAVTVSGIATDKDISEAEDNLNSDGSSKTDTPKSTCQISGIGWLVCPVLSFLGGLADGVYYILDTVFLRLPPVNMDLNDKANGMYISWKIMRDVANIVFVIAFLMIVFSQITSIGISNYGLKKLVPKLIMAAILVNISFFICAAAVDVSNILGTSLKSLLDGASKDILPPETATALNSGGFWQGIITGVLVISFVGTAALAGFATLSLAIGALLFVVPIVVTVLITMIVRQALVVLLIVVSPLAFVALLLPNTESYYKKWLELFKAMLLMYPIIALMFGASSLASTVLMAAAKDAGDLQVLHQIAGGAVRVLPLVFIPALMKISSGTFGRITGVMNDRQKGWFDAKRNANAERGKIQKANRIAGIGRWARENPSLRRRGLAAMTAYGSSNREIRRKDDLNTAQNKLEGAYLGERKNVEARNAVKNSQLELHDAELHAETVRLNGAEALHLQQQSMIAEAEKQIAENKNKELATGMVSTELKVQQATSARNLANVESRDKQAIEELSAAGDSNSELLAAYGVDAATAKAAQTASFESKATDSATNTARVKGEEEYAGDILNNPTGPYATQAAGKIDPEKGLARAQARASSTQLGSTNEAVKNAMDLMKRETNTPAELLTRAKQDLEKASENGDVVQARAAAQILSTSGEQGFKLLTQTIDGIEKGTIGKLDQNVMNNLRGDLLGNKANDAALDKWATAKIKADGTYDPYSSFAQSGAVFDGLTEQELASQKTYVLEAANISQQQAKSVLSLAAKGTVTLTPEKRRIFTNAASKIPPAPTNPATPGAQIYGPSIPPTGIRPDDV